jgi:hypothetical protein
MEDSNLTNIRRRLSLSNNTPSPTPLEANSHKKNNLDIDALLRQEDNDISNDNNDESNNDDNFSSEKVLLTQGKVEDHLYDGRYLTFLR